MTTVNDVLLKIEQLAPKNLAEGFDNVGLLIGRSQKQVKKIMVMLDADNRTINEAIKANIDVIVTHHPIIFSPIKAITDEKLLKLIENDISVISAHTNLDSADGGVNDVLVQTLGLNDIQSVVFTEGSPLCGKAGNIKPCTFKQLIDLVKAKLNIDKLRYVGDLNKVVSKIGVLGGSGADFIGEMKDLGCDVFITADIKYHEAQFADDIDMCIIDAGHFETENLICKPLSKYLQDAFTDIEVLVSKREQSYIKYE